MTVKQLIEKLKEFDENKDVYFTSELWIPHLEVNSVYTTTVRANPKKDIVVLDNE